MLSLSPQQLCDYYLDGNLEAAFEVFEHAGPDGLRQFLGIEDLETWRLVYPVLLHDREFLVQLCRKYQPYLSQLIEEQGIRLFREFLHIESPAHDGLMDAVFFALDPQGSRVLAYTRANARELWGIAQHRGADELKKELGLSTLSSGQLDQVWQAVLDELLDSYMRDVFHQRQRVNVGEFFAKLRQTLRWELGL